MVLLQSIRNWNYPPHQNIQTQTAPSNLHNFLVFICLNRVLVSMSMQLQLTITKMRMMFFNTTTARASSTSLRMIGALIAMALLLWTIHYGYQRTTEPRRHPLYGQWISRIGALIMLFGFLFLAVGLPIIADLFLRLFEELQCPEEADLCQNSSLKVKIDVSV